MEGIKVIVKVGDCYLIGNAVGFHMDHPDTPEWSTIGDVTIEGFTYNPSSSYVYKYDEKIWAEIVQIEKNRKHLNSYERTLTNALSPLDDDDIRTLWPVR